MHLALCFENDAKFSVKFWRMTLNRVKFLGHDANLALSFGNDAMVQSAVSMQFASGALLLVASTVSSRPHSSSHGGA